MCLICCCSSKGIVVLPIPFKKKAIGIKQYQAVVSDYVFTSIRHMPFVLLKDANHLAKSSDFLERCFIGLNMFETHTHTRIFIYIYISY